MGLAHCHTGLNHPKLRHIFSIFPFFPSSFSSLFFLICLHFQAKRIKTWKKIWTGNRRNFPQIFLRFKDGMNFRKSQTSLELWCYPGVVGPTVFGTLSLSSSRSAGLLPTGCIFNPIFLIWTQNTNLNLDPKLKPKFSPRTQT